jgi:hypothetical protein
MKEMMFHVLHFWFVLVAPGHTSVCERALVASIEHINLLIFHGLLC